MLPIRGHQGVLGRHRHPVWVPAAWLWLVGVEPVAALGLLRCFEFDPGGLAHLEEAAIVEKRGLCQRLRRRSEDEVLVFVCLAGP